MHVISLLQLMHVHMRILHKCEIGKGRYFSHKCVLVKGDIYSVFVSAFLEYIAYWLNNSWNVYVLHRHRCELIINYICC